MSSHLVPMVIEQTRHGERAFDIYSKLLKERIVFVGTSIDETVANLVTASLIFLEHEDPDREINMYINSPGGTVYSGLAIYDTMQFIKPDVATFCFGMGMSMGAILLAGGAKGKRFALPNAKIMIHQGHGGFEGTPADIEIHAKEVLSLRRKAIEILSFHTGQPFEHVEKDIERDRFMTAEEAKAYGIIDEIVATRKSEAFLSEIGAPNGRVS